MSPARWQMPDRDASQAHHCPPGWYREPLVVRCTKPECPSAMSMPAGTPPAAQAIRLEIADWTQGPAGPVCGVDHDTVAAVLARRSWWRRWVGGR